MAMIEVNWRPDTRTLRGFGLLSTLAFAAIGAWVWFRHSLFGFSMSPESATTAATVLWVVAGVCLAAAAVASRALWPLYVVLTAISLPIGFVVSHLVLAIVFFGVFAPLGLVMRLLGRDPLQRRFDAAADTYWVRREPPPEIRRYFRQW